jgi:hypothetical protein
MQMFESQTGKLRDIALSICRPRPGDDVHENVEVLSAFASPQIDAEACRIERAATQNSGRVNRLPGSTNREVNVPTGVLEAFRMIDVLREIVVLDLRRKLRRKLRRVKVSNPVDTALRGHHRIPDLINGMADRRDAPHAGNNNATSHNGTLPRKAETRRPANHRSVAMCGCVCNAFN